MILTVLLTASALSLAHPGSFSRSQVTVDGRDLQHSMRLQALTLIETLPIDQDDNLVLDEYELESAREEIAWYLGQNYRFFPNDDQDEALRGEFLNLELVLDGSPDLPTNYWIHADFEYSCSSTIKTITVEESLFETSNPQHVEYVSVGWIGEEPNHHVFSAGDVRHTFEPTGRGQKGLLHSFFDMGVGHILTGYDHLLFLVALLVAVRSLKSLLGVITAFTLAHSLTLALAALRLVSLPASFVEIAIALSIVYVAVENLMNLEKRMLWFEALVFGLLHGLGFASFLSDALRRGDALLVPLIGFNAGVEAGQALVVIPLALGFHLFARRGKQPAEGEPPSLLVPLQLGRFVSITVVFIGLFWFAERAGFIA